MVRVGTVFLSKVGFFVLGYTLRSKALKDGRSRIRYISVSLASRAVMVAYLSSLCIGMPVSSLADADKGTFFLPIRQCNDLIMYKIGKCTRPSRKIRPGTRTLHDKRIKEWAAVAWTKRILRSET